jgi:hypothetical protein
LSSELGQLLSRQHAQPLPGLSLQRAQVVTWDATNGHVIMLAGANVAEPFVLASVGTLTPGDVVAVLRQKTSVLILGVIQAPA